MKLSIIIIAKNGETYIKNAVTSVKFADEILVVDSGSTDKTVLLAKEMGAVVLTHISEDFSDIRNYGLEKAKGEWILYVDVDEVVSEELAKSIIKTIESKETHKAYRIKRKNFYYGNHEWPQIEKLERLFQKKYLKGWYGKLHESAKVDGSIGDVEGFLYHYSHQDLTAMLTKTILWSKTEAELRLHANHPKMVWWRFPRVMVSAFWNSYIKQGGWRVGTVGLIESTYQAFSMFITYARLWEMQQNQKGK